MSLIASIATVLRPSSPGNPPDNLQRAATDGVCGRGTVKFLAKIASDMNKPNGQFVLRRQKFRHFYKPYRWQKSPARQSLGGKTGSDGAADLR